MGTVFTHFGSVEYKFLTINHSTTKGDVITSSKTLSGIFKLRDGMVEGDRELRLSDATLHVHPEDFDSVDELVGNGILYNGVFYGIVGATAGTNFDTHEVEHYRLTLQIKKYANAGDYA